MYCCTNAAKACQYIVREIFPPLLNEFCRQNKRSKVVNGFQTCSKSCQWRSKSCQWRSKVVNGFQTFKSCQWLPRLPTVYCCTNAAKACQYIVREIFPPLLNEFRRQNRRSKVVNGFQNAQNIWIMNNIITGTRNY